MTQSYLIDEIIRTTTSPSSDIDKLTNAHDAHRSNFSGSSAPSTLTAYQIYANTTDNVFYRIGGDGSTPRLMSSASQNPVILKTSNYTALKSDFGGLILVDASSGPVTITLPPNVSGLEGWHAKIKKVDSSSNAVIVTAVLLIDGVTAVSIIQQNITVGFRKGLTTYSIDQNDPSQMSFPGSLALLQRYTPSTVSSIDILSLITSTYDDYVFRFSLAFSTANSSLQLTASSNNGTSFISSGYEYAHGKVTSSGNQDKVTDSSASEWHLIQNVSSSSGDIAQGEVKLKGLQDTSFNKIIHSSTDYVDNSDAYVNYVGGGNLSSLLNINALKIEISSGTMTGIIDFFGVAK